MRLNILYLLVYIIALNSSCTDANDKKVAKVFNHTLYNSQIDYNAWDIMDKQDSVVMKNIFTEHWIHKQLLLQHAKISSEDKKIIDQLTEDYRNSLIIDFFENKIINERLDTAISDQELKDYYNQIKNDFKLDETVVNLKYIKIVAEKKTIDKIKQLWALGKYKAILDFINLGPEESALHNDFWVSKSELEKIIPKSLIQNNDTYQTQKNINGTEYFIKVTGSRHKNEFIPLPLVKNELFELILKKRKTDLIDSFIADLYKQETKNNNIKLYE